MRRLIAAGPTFVSVALAAVSAVPAVAQAPATTPRATLVQPSPHIGGVKLHTIDVEKAVRFYQTVFQMKLFNAPANGGTGETMLDFPDLPAPAQPAGSVPEPFIVLSPDPSFVHGNTNVADIFIRVPDVEAVRKRAADAGYTALPGNTLVLKDPSGNLIEVTIQRYFMPAR